MTDDDYLALAKKTLEDWVFVGVTRRLTQESYDILYRRVAAALKGLHQQERQDWLDCAEYREGEVTGWKLSRLMARYRYIFNSLIMSATPYPEHEKLRQVQGKSQAIADFLDWAREKHSVLGEYPVDATGKELPEFGLQPVITSRERLLAQFFGIDLRVLEQERRAMLERLREQREKL